MRRTCPRSHLNIKRRSDRNVGPRSVGPVHVMVTLMENVEYGVDRTGAPGLGRKLEAGLASHGRARYGLDKRRQLISQSSAMDQPVCV